MRHSLLVLVMICSALVYMGCDAESHMYRADDGTLVKIGYCPSCSNRVLDWFLEDYYQCAPARKYCQDHDGYRFTSCVCGIKTPHCTYPSYACRGVQNNDMRYDYDDCSIQHVYCIVVED